jgi:hypothetical protein
MLQMVCKMAAPASGPNKDQYTAFANRQASCKAAGLSLCCEPNTKNPATPF